MGKSAKGASAPLPKLTKLTPEQNGRLLLRLPKFLQGDKASVAKAALAGRALSSGARSTEQIAEAFGIENGDDLYFALLQLSLRGLINAETLDGKSWWRLAVPGKEWESATLDEPADVAAALEEELGNAPEEAWGLRPGCMDPAGLKPVLLLEPLNEVYQRGALAWAERRKAGKAPGRPSKFADKSFLASLVGEALAGPLAPPPEQVKHKEDPRPKSWEERAKRKPRKAKKGALPAPSDELDWPMRVSDGLEEQASAGAGDLQPVNGGGPQR